MVRGKFKTTSFFAHPLVVTIVGTGIVAFAAAFLSSYYNNQAWLRQTKYELFKEELGSGVETVNRISQLISQRFFGLQIVFRTAQGVSSGNLDEAWGKYYDSVIQWNVFLRQNRDDLILYTDNETANLFMNEQDARSSYSGETPATVHGYFVRAHRLVKSYVDCIKNKCDEQIKKDLPREITGALNNLGALGDEFVSQANKKVRLNVRKRYALPSDLVLMEKK